ncbi:MAG: hypothetical protein RBS68_13155 [Anaerolineales bacterium]|nr:hypothetical protein [Anaerolineales bacterium]
MQIKRLHWFEISLLLIVIGVHLYAAFSSEQNFPQRWFTRDDAYYYFKVAQNISEGKGSTFDGINPTNGYHPLWLAVNVPVFALARFDLILPLRLLMLVMAALSAATSILLFRLLRRVLAEPIALLAAAFWAFSLSLHQIITQPGMETGITALSVVLLLTVLQAYELRWRAKESATGNRAALVTRQEMVWLALAALFALFSRLDAIYLLLITGIWIVFRGTPLRSLLPADMLAALVLLVTAFVQRAGLEIYMLNFSASAMLTFGLVLLVQSLAFYFFGLYQHPKNAALLPFLRRAALGVSIPTLILIIFSLLGGAFGISIPRAVGLYYLIGISLWVLLSRLGYAALSPWARLPLNKPDSALENLRQNWRTWLERGLIYYGLSALALGAYMLLNRWLFGTFMPVSGQIKRWWGSLGDNAYGGAAKSLLDIFGLDPQHSQPWELLFAPLQTIASQTPFSFWVVLAAFISLFGLAAALNRQKTANALSLLGLIPLGISAGLHATFYGAMPYAARHEWYWVLQMLTVVIGLALFGHLATARIRQQASGRTTLWVFSLLTSLWLAWGFGAGIVNRMTYEQPSGPAYMDVLPLIEANTEPGAVIGMTGGGNIGYYIQDRTIVNMDGLINSYPYFMALQANRAPQYLKDVAGMDYVFANPYLLLSSAPYSYQFQGWLTEIPGVPLYGKKQILKFDAPGQ